MPWPGTISMTICYATTLEKHKVSTLAPDESYTEMRYLAKDRQTFPFHELSNRLYLRVPTSNFIDSVRPSYQGGRGWDSSYLDS